MSSQTRVERPRRDAIRCVESDTGGLRRTLFEVAALGAVTVGVLAAGLRIAQLEAREQLQQPAPEACRASTETRGCPSAAK
jgi:hypothetical protein